MIESDDDGSSSSCDVLNVARIPKTPVSQDTDDGSIDSTIPRRTNFPRRYPLVSPEEPLEHQRPPRSWHRRGRPRVLVYNDDDDDSEEAARKPAARILATEFEERNRSNNDGDDNASEVQEILSYDSQQPTQPNAQYQTEQLEISSATDETEQTSEIYECETISRLKDKNAPRTDFERMFPEFIDLFGPEERKQDTGRSKISRTFKYGRSEFTTSLRKVDPSNCTGNHVMKDSSKPSLKSRHRKCSDRSTEMETRNELDHNFSKRMEEEREIICLDSDEKSESPTLVPTAKQSTMPIHATLESTAKLDPYITDGSDSDASFILDFPDSTLTNPRKRKAVQLAFKKERKRQRLEAQRLRKEERDKLKQQKQESMMKRGYYAKHEICAVVHPETHLWRSTILERLQDSNTVPSFPVTTRFSVYIRSIQFLRRNYVGGGAIALKAALEKDDDFDHATCHFEKQLVIVFETIEEFKVLLAHDHDNDDYETFSTLLKSVDSMKDSWRQECKQTVDPRLIILLPHDFRETDEGEDNDLMYSATHFLRILHEVECIPCASQSIMLKFLQRMSMAICKSPYAKPPVEVELFRKVPPANHLQNQDEVVQDTWYRMLCVFPRVSPDRAQ